MILLRRNDICLLTIEDKWVKKQRIVKKQMSNLLPPFSLDQYQAFILNNPGISIAF